MIVKKIIKYDGFMYSNMVTFIDGIEGIESIEDIGGIDKLFTL